MKRHGNSRRIRYRFYVNEHLVHQSDMTREEADRAQETGQKMLKPADRWIMIFEDRAGEIAPWCFGNDDTFGPKIVRELFPGRKLPEGEMGWQKRNGVRLPPETGLHDIDFGISGLDHRDAT